MIPKDNYKAVLVKVPQISGLNQCLNANGDVIYPTYWLNSHTQESAGNSFRYHQLHDGSVMCRGLRCTGRRVVFGRLNKLTASITAQGGWEFSVRFLFKGGKHATHLSFETIQKEEIKKPKITLYKGFFHLKALWVHHIKKYLHLIFCKENKKSHLEKF